MARKRSLLDKVKVSPLQFGIHKNIVLSKVDITPKKRNGMPTKRFLHLTFTKIDPETGKRKAESTFSWWKLDPTSDNFMTNMKQLLVQLDGILKLYYTEEEIDAQMEDLFKEWKFKTVSDVENYKWKKKDADLFMNKLSEKIAEALKIKIGFDSTQFKLKLPLDNKGQYPELPRYGVFVESMDVSDEKSTLSFSDYEQKNNALAGKAVEGVKTTSPTAAGL